MNENTPMHQDPQPEALDSLSAAYWSGDLEPQVDDEDSWPEGETAEYGLFSTLVDSLAELKTQQVALRRGKQVTRIPLIGALFIGLAIPQIVGLAIMGMIFNWWRMDIVQADTAKRR